MTRTYQPEIPLDAILFDCDGTLSAIEGIDFLADLNGTGDEVKKLTADAMGRTGINSDIYLKRLQLVLPAHAKLQTLGQTYIDHCVPDIAAVIQLLQRLDKAIYIVSAGLYPAVVALAQFLKIPKKHVFAVDIRFDSDGNYLDFDRASPLVNNTGKRDIVSLIKNSHQQLAFVGDGANDLAAMDVVTRFVGYGGIYYRENIAKLCQYYICTQSMSALLPLVLTEQECLALNSYEKSLYKNGIEAVTQKKIMIK